MNSPQHDPSPRADLPGPIGRTSSRPDGDPAAPSTRPPAAPAWRKPWRVRLRRRLTGRHARGRHGHNPAHDGNGGASTATGTSKTRSAVPTSACGAEGEQPTSRTRTRRSDARAAGAWARAGWNTGSVPYGYRARRVLVTPAHGRPRYRSRLVIEPVEAATVRQIFLWRSVDHLSTTEIVQRLSAARYPQPLHPTTGQPRPWNPRLIRSLLANPKYLGQQAWGRTRDGRPRPPDEWIWSAANPYLALVTPETFAAAQRTRVRRVPTREGHTVPTGQTATASASSAATATRPKLPSRLETPQ